MLPDRAGSRGGAPGRQVSPRLPHARPFMNEKRRGRQPGGGCARKKVAGVLGIDAAGSASSAAEVSTQGDASSPSYGHFKSRLFP